jgi:hypothetical protein
VTPSNKAHTRQLSLVEWSVSTTDCWAFRRVKIRSLFSKRFSEVKLLAKAVKVWLVRLFQGGLEAVSGPRGEGFLNLLASFR